MAENSHLNRFIQQPDIANLPVLHNTLQALKDALEKPVFNYRLLDNILKFDPACMINLLAYANQEINKDFDKQISQVEHAAMFLGMERLEKFINKISSVYRIKDKNVANKIVSLQHRGVHAAFQAQNLALMINAPSMDEIYTSTLISPLSELVCWNVEPIKAQKVELLIHKQQKNYEEAQREIFGFSYHELAEALTHQWKIPNLFLQRQEMADLDKVSKPIMAMYLAEKCSIFAEKGWYYDGMYEHLSTCAKHLHYSDARIAHEFHKTAATMAHLCTEFYPIQRVCSYLPLLPGEVPYTQVINIETRKKVPPPMPTPTPAEKVVPKAKAEPTKIASSHLINSANDFPGLVRVTMDALFETGVFTRVAFMMLSKDKKALQVRSIRGFTNKKFTESTLAMQPVNLFTKLLEKSQSVLINQVNYQKFSPIINQSMQQMLNVQAFIAKSVHVNNKPIGLFYMDKHPLDNEQSKAELEIDDFNQMKKICALFDKQLKAIS